MTEPTMRELALEKCQLALPGWRDATIADFHFADPKGFSSFTMGITANRPLEPQAVLYRHLATKENAILDFDSERDVFLLLGEAGIAARCHHYDDSCRIEHFYDGRTLSATDVFDPEIQRGIADQLFALHQLQPPGLPQQTFFELLHDKWGDLARRVLTDQRSEFPLDERPLCDDLLSIADAETLSMVMRCLPPGPPVFCHNDTYHGNVMRLESGEIRLLDFEFSCLNHVAFDFANLFAETVMVHGLEDPPHFAIAEPTFADADLASFIGFYVDNMPAADRAAAQQRLLAETKRAIMLSDYMYAMAALPLAVQPIQRIRFLPYAHQRFARFIDSWNAEFDRSRT